MHHPNAVAEARPFCNESLLEVIDDSHSREVALAGKGRTGFPMLICSSRTITDDDDSP